MSLQISQRSPQTTSEHTQECKDVQAKWFSDHFNKPRALIWLCNCWCHGETE